MLSYSSYLIPVFRSDCLVLFNMAIRYQLMAGMVFNLICFKTIFKIHCFINLQVVWIWNSCGLAMIKLFASHWKNQNKTKLKKHISRLYFCRRNLQCHCKRDKWTSENSKCVCFQLRECFFDVEVCL